MQKSMKNLLISFLCVLIIALQRERDTWNKINVTVNYSQLTYTYTLTYNFHADRTVPSQNNRIDNRRCCAKSIEIKAHK